MKTKLMLLTTSLLLLGSLFACVERKSCCLPPPNDNYLPHAIGNYWRVDANNYIEVADRINLNGKEYFVLHSFMKNVPDVAFQRDTFYVRVDERNNLIRGLKNNLNYTEIIANFNMMNGQEIQLGTGNIRVMERKDGRIQFRHDCLVCASFPSYYYSTYIKNRGFADRNFIFSKNLGLVKPFKETRIDGVVYQLL